MADTTAAVPVLLCVHCGSCVDDGSCVLCNVPPDALNVHKVLRCAECGTQLGAGSKCPSCGREIK